ncbi:hypothetical protein LSTR_LSTR006360 [Laodelphax striatellus]|uniref:Uncharacterized protein n=1 Tax=Laodelphax striatellus TaxID=195883 RepID=A0A482XEF4_LAOST|nr:hypothetical protein LSTR_LSTR006360 [Laodelphax striatellus]
MGLQGLVSIGCGTGLLEWLLMMATGLKVIGLERDRLYWSSKPNFKPFLQHLYPEDSNFVECCTSDKYALAFCYFNYREAFDEYVDNYKGTCVIIIGPGEGRGTHTDPEPFNPKFRSERWRLKESQEICGTKDYIAVYARPSCSEQHESCLMLN